MKRELLVPWLLIAATTCAGGCAFEPAGREPLDPPSWYREAHDSAQACTGRRGRFEELRWYVVEGYSFPCPTGQCAGYTRGDEITLAADWTGHPMVVKHELIHALGVEGHPAVPFEEPCHATWASYARGLTSKAMVTSIHP